MQAIILNGARKGDTSLDAIHALLLEELIARRWNVTPFILRKLDIAPCDGDLQCWLRTPGLCKHSGVVNDIAYRVVHSDLSILLTPVTFGGYSSELTRTVDHLVSLISPLLANVRHEIRHAPRYTHYPQLFALGMQPSPDPESAALFTKLVASHAANLYAPAYEVGILTGNQRLHEIRTKIAAAITRLEDRA